MGLVKRIGKSERIRDMLCGLVAQYVRLVWSTGRWEVERSAAAAALFEQGKPFICAFWHGRLLMLPRSWPAGRPFAMLISQHRDGQLIAHTMARFGITTIAGSTTRGGSAALRSMLRALKSGTCVGITPDGPRGPRMHASDGVVSVAKLSGCPVVPCTYAVTRGKILGSWDRLLIPFPFTRGRVIWGEPIWVPADADAAQLDEYRERIETALSAQITQADRATGREPVLPA